MPDLYLDLMKRCLTRLAFPDGTVGMDLKYSNTFDPVKREHGLDWPARAETMIGMKRLDNIQECLYSVFSAEIPGDLVECGVWRGGASIFMRAVCAQHEEHRNIWPPPEKRNVWVCDSFEGLPKPKPGQFPADAGDQHWRLKSYLAVSLEEVKANFERYGLLDERVKFLQGWFEDTLPAAPIERIAVLRADGDMYQSTWDILTNLYAKVSPGGYVIVDDYGNGNTPGCRKAVDDFRARNGIADAIESVDWTGVYWRKNYCAELRPVLAITAGQVSQT